jgi:minor histocompatibility antigen H13
MLLIATSIVYCGCILNLYNQDKENEVLTNNEAAMMPIFASAVLISFYVIIKYLDRNYFDMFMMALVIIVGLISWFQLFHFISTIQRKSQLLSIWNFIQFTIGLAIHSHYYYTKYWISNNLIATCLALSGIMHGKLSSFKTGIIMLSGLFVYDIGR